MENPCDWYDDEFSKAEWRVNGIWNAIFTSHFPHGIGLVNWIVAPEAYPTWDDTQSLAADLCVAQLDGDVDGSQSFITTPVLTYEGKGGNSARTWDDIQKQIQDWCMRGVRVGTVFGAPFCGWAVGAKGKRAKFSVFDGAKIFPVGVHTDGAGARSLRKQDDQPVDITVEAGWSYVQFMMAAVVADPTLTAQKIRNM